MSQTTPEPGSRVVSCPACGKRNRVPAVAAGHPTCGSCRAPLPWLVDADDDTFAAVTGGSTPVLVDLWAAWCGPCRMVSPAVEQVGRELAGRLKVVKVDVDRSPQVAARYGVQAIPTLLFLVDGREAARQIGAVPAPTLGSWTRAQLQSVEAGRSSGT